MYYMQMYYPIIDRYTFYENLPNYILITIVLVFLTIFVYIKLAFPFWNAQPVYHSYDFWRALYRHPFRIHQRFTPLAKSKYLDAKEVEIVPFAEATEYQKKGFVNLLQCYSMESDNTLFFYNLENMDAYFSGHMFSSYFSFCKTPTYKKISENDIPSRIGCISSRSGELYVRGNKEAIYYIDHLVMQRDKDHRGISRKLMETHIYKTNIISKMDLEVDPIMVQLFRRERELLTGIVPITRFRTSVYELPNNPAYYFDRKLPEHVLCVEIHSGNTDLLIDFLIVSRTRYDILGITDVANLVGLIKTGVFYVYVLKRLDDIFGVYIFRDTRIQEEERGCVVELVASISNTSSMDLFTTGFLQALGSIVKKRTVFKLLKMDDLADNGYLILSVFRKLGEEWAAYYLYNYVVPGSPVLCSRVFILF